MPSSSRMLVVLLAAFVALLAAPALASPAPAGPTNSVADPLADLGATSPTCRDDVGAEARRNCTATGAVAQRYPLNSYGFDTQIGFSISHLDRSFLGALQAIGALLWMALVFLVKGVLLLLEWGFSIDLLGSAMSQARQALATLHDQVIGQPWFLTALGVTALWAIWRGFVQRQAAQTITGLAATIALMVCGLVVLAEPDATVGYASRLANDAALSVLSATSARQLGRPTRSLAAATIALFDSTVRDPWCALEFGSVEYCDRHAKGSQRLTNADVWLQFPAQSTQRKGLYRLLKGEKPDGSRSLIGTVTHPALSVVGLGGGDLSSHLPDGVKGMVAKDPPRAAMQEAGGTFTRFALLALIALGVLGAVALLAYLGIRLLLASVLALLLLLFTPAVLLAPAFGESGRATFIAWAKRLAGAIAAKLVYALFLAVVLTAAAALRRLDIGWFGTWLLQIAFWWGVLLKRHELIGFVSVPGNLQHQGRSGLGSVLTQAYYGMQVGRLATRTAQHAAGRSGALVGAAKRRSAGTREHRVAAAGQLAGEQLDEDGRRVLAGRQELASTAMAERGQLERELRVVDRRLAGFDETHAGARANAMPSPLPTTDQAALVRRRRELLDRLSSPDMRSAAQVILHADRNRAQTGQPVTPRDLATYRSQRAADHAAGLAIDDERHLRAAGIDPQEYRGSQGEARADMSRSVERFLKRERQLLAATATAAPDPRHAGLRIDPDDFRTKVAARRATARRQRRADRLGSGAVRR